MKLGLTGKILITLLCLTLIPSCKNSREQIDRPAFFEVKFETNNEKLASVKAAYKNGTEITSGTKVEKESLIVFFITHKDYDYTNNWEINKIIAPEYFNKTKIELTIAEDVSVKVNFAKIHYDETKPNITLRISETLKNGEDETDITLTVGARNENTAIQIDWGSGKEDFTIGSGTPVIITRTVDAGSDIKIYGKLNHFNASGNKFITGISFYNSSQLEIVRLSQNKINTIDLSTLPALKEIHLTDNNLTEIDLSHCENLEEFYCAWNTISALNTEANPKLTVLTCYNTGITELDISSNKELEVLTAGDNNYSKNIILDNNTKLKSIDLENCNFKNIDVTKLTKLKTLKLSGNNLTGIDLKNNILLSYLDLGKNMIKELELDKLTELEQLRINGNVLLNLDLSNNKKLNVIDLKNNKFKACALNDLYFLMNHPVDVHNSFAVDGNIGAAGSKTKTAKDKGWRIDVTGDGSGCDTVKLKFKPAEHGSFKTFAGGKEINEWTPIIENSLVEIKAAPAKGYALSKIMLNGKNVPANSFVLNEYGLLEVLFSKKP